MSSRPVFGRRADLTRGVALLLGRCAARSELGRRRLPLTDPLPRPTYSPPRPTYSPPRPTYTSDRQINTRRVKVLPHGVKQVQLYKYMHHYRELIPKK